MATNPRLDGDVIIPTTDVVVFNEDVSGTVRIDPIHVGSVHGRPYLDVMDMHRVAEYRVDRPKGRVLQGDTGDFNVLAVEELDEVRPARRQL